MLVTKTFMVKDILPSTESLELATMASYGAHVTTVPEWTHGNSHVTF